MDKVGDKKTFFNEEEYEINQHWFLHTIGQWK